MSSLKIIEYSPELQQYFEKINKQWVEQYFTLEPIDLAQLKNPKETILDKGGAILFAKEGEKIIGTVGLSKVEDGVFEMIKMGVSPEAQGKKVGQLLGQAILEKAKELGAHKVILYSNSKLVAALHLYKKLGFKELVPECGKYNRCDVKMEMDL
ncbi:GNAT family N-acetyltransferase [Aquiflexum lacus]|uniref:GNAT family N-acetyltransferase n=1 Tax=Aquiflexum lacus TaxID=2483805 RepID=UPI001893C14D|nr:GNAT family N-acetyltransferase [Aquiflexum lacus]